MIKNKRKENFQFWKINEREGIKIINSKLLEFIESKGFATANLNSKSQILVQKQNNRMSIASEFDIDQIIKIYLEEKGQREVYETYIKGMGSYISKRKFNLLKRIDLVNDRDFKDSSNFFYKDCYCTVTKDSIKLKQYEELETPIWENRILNHSYSIPSDDSPGQFEVFCRNITDGSEERFNALKTILGYLLHRNKDVGESKAVIFYDEMMGFQNQAHGGTGKTLLSQALAKCREVEIFDGKEIKAGSFFKNQRIELTTDILVYDDLNSKASLESFYTMITSGVEIEKKGQQSYFIKHEDSPKILITSNYPVGGPGGPSDIRRRHEFELCNYYNADFTPELEFGNRFFGELWSQEEWNKFFYFMMTCVEDYLKNGLIKVASINIEKAKLTQTSSQKFVEFADEHMKFNDWLDKRKFQESFKRQFPLIENVSPHIFTKWIYNYSRNNLGKYESKSSGSRYLFKVRKELANV